jgi:aryl-alcohol dehydrogenase-like predicted oxidoreductase
LSKNNEITAIPGTRKINRLEENLGAYHVELTSTDFDVIEASMPKTTIGSRY